MSMNYIIELSFSDDFDIILIYINRFMKMIHFYPIIIKVIMKDIIQFYLQYIFKYHELFNNIISNHETQFISHFTIQLLNLYKIYNNKSIIFHS